MNAPQILERFDRRKHKRLAVAPQAVAKLLTAFDDENVTLVELGRIIENFPSIAVRIIGLANSAWSSPVQEITSLSVACNRLGLNVTRSVSLALAIAEPFNSGRCQPFSQEKFWCDSLMRAEAATRIATILKRVDPQNARTTALISSIGMLWLADAAPVETGNALQCAAEGEDESVYHAIRATFDVGYDTIGAAVASSWKLPGSMVNAIQRQCRTDRFIELTELERVVSAANWLTGQLSHDAEEPQGYAAAAQWISQEAGDLDALYADLAGNKETFRELANSLFNRHDKRSAIR